MAWLRTLFRAGDADDARNLPLLVDPQAGEAEQRFLMRAAADAGMPMEEQALLEQRLANRDASRVRYGLEGGEGFLYLPSAGFANEDLSAANLRALYDAAARLVLDWNERLAETMDRRFVNETPLRAELRGELAEPGHRLVSNTHAAYFLDERPDVRVAHATGVLHTRVGELQGDTPPAYRDRSELLERPVDAAAVVRFGPEPPNVYMPLAALAVRRKPPAARVRTPLEPEELPPSAPPTRSLHEMSSKKAAATAAPKRKRAAPSATSAWAKAPARSGEAPVPPKRPAAEPPATAPTARPVPASVPTQKPKAAAAAAATRGDGGRGAAGGGTGVSDNVPVQLVPSVYEGAGRAGDFGWMIDRPEWRDDSLFVFNDNAAQFDAFLAKQPAGFAAGGGNAIVRPYRAGQRPRAAGVPTGAQAGAGNGYSSLGNAARYKIDEALRVIAVLLESRRYRRVIYSARGPSGELGTGVFVVGDDVKRYIVEGLRRVVARAPPHRRTTAPAAAQDSQATQAMDADELPSASVVPPSLPGSDNDAPTARPARNTLPVTAVENEQPRDEARDAPSSSQPRRRRADGAMSPVLIDGRVVRQSAKARQRQAREAAEKRTRDAAALAVRALAELSDKAAASRGLKRPLAQVERDATSQEGPQNTSNIVPPAKRQELVEMVAPPRVGSLGIPTPMAFPAPGVMDNETWAAWVRSWRESNRDLMQGAHPEYEAALSPVIATEETDGEYRGRPLTGVSASAVGVFSAPRGYGGFGGPLGWPVIPQHGSVLSELARLAQLKVLEEARRSAGIDPLREPVTDQDSAADAAALRAYEAGSIEYAAALYEKLAADLVQETQERVRNGDLVPPVEVFRAAGDKTIRYGAAGYLTGTDPAMALEAGNTPSPRVLRLLLRASEDILRSYGGQVPEEEFTNGHYVRIWLGPSLRDPETKDASPWASYIVALAPGWGTLARPRLHGRELVTATPWRLPAAFAEGGQVPRGALRWDYREPAFFPERVNGIEVRETRDPTDPRVGGRITGSFGGQRPLRWSPDVPLRNELVLASLRPDASNVYRPRDTPALPPPLANPATADALVPRRYSLLPLRGTSASPRFTSLPVPASGGGAGVRLPQENNFVVPIRGPLQAEEAVELPASMVARQRFEKIKENINREKDDLRPIAWLRVKDELWDLLNQAAAPGILRTASETRTPYELRVLRFLFHLVSEECAQRMAALSKSLDARQTQREYGADAPRPVQFTRAADGEAKRTRRTTQPVLPEPLVEPEVAARDTYEAALARFLGEHPTAKAADEADMWRLTREHVLASQTAPRGENGYTDAYLDELWRLVGARVALLRARASGQDASYRGRLPPPMPRDLGVPPVELADDAPPLPPLFEFDLPPLPASPPPPPPSGEAADSEEDGRLRVLSSAPLRPVGAAFSHVAHLPILTPDEARDIVRCVRRSARLEAKRQRRPPKKYGSVYYCGDDVPRSGG